MTRTLEERLAELADVEERGQVPSVAELWRRGERWQRRRRAVTSVALGCVVMILGGAAWWGSEGGMTNRDPAPATSDVPVAVPDTVYEVSSWLGLLPEGPVVAVQEVERASWWGSDRAVAAIAAHGGSYGFLDLADYAGDVSLSPDGERVAYWGTGVPSGDPQTNGGQTTVVTALVLHDLTTGETQRHDVPTEHGLSTDDIVWLEDDSLVANFSQHAVGDSASPREQGRSQLAESLWWHMDEDSPRVWPWGGEYVPSLSFSATRDGRALLQEDGIWWVDPATRQRTRLTGRLGGTGAHMGYPTLAWASDGRLATVGGLKNSRMPALLRLAEVTGPESAVQWRTVPHSRGTFGLLGWRDGAVITHRRIPGDESYRTALFTVDPDDGSMTPFVTHDPAKRSGLGLLSTNWRWATGLLENAPVVAGVQPPSPVDPRFVAGLSLGAVVAVLAGLVLWRRRGHP